MNKNLLSQDMTSQIDKICSLAPVIPVLTIENIDDAVPMAQALVDGGLPVLEVTLRTAAGLRAIEAIARHVPEAKVGAGTVITPDDYKRATDSGSTFIVSPGTTTELLDYGISSNIPLLPGIQTVSEMLEGIQRGYKRFKFFPAEISGGTNTLKAFQGPFADIRFCPTGGIRPNTAANYLALSNVMCVGGTWLTPSELVAARDWSAIAKLAQQTLHSTR
ncbi:MAG: bifunctional 4-hydroxy-2-oxoglutarate aldolase/2-dehydro-3-deoxy-phosphogluconate aldolase [Amphritea sp.]